MKLSSHTARDKKGKNPKKPQFTPVKHRLNQYYATAICGNDITSSCLYVAAICTVFAGYLAPVCLVIVAFILFLYRKVYAEVGDALPLNGGAYNALLNSTTKFKASLAACMTILSYIATAVISAKTAVEYFSHALFHVPVILYTIAVLAVFTVLAILGITESARVALSIFVIHITSLVIFIGYGIYHLCLDSTILMQNLATSLPSGHGIFAALFLGVSSGLLGISGFESSANFIEEQAPGVFVKTLRNMWVAVTLFNPVIAFLALSTLPISLISESKDFLLSDMASVLSGKWLNIMIGIDATLVLCGAVLTSFIGVGGLVRRMALDRCLPQFLLFENRRGTTHRIFIVFFLMCSSIILLTKGDLLALGGVYTISFLGVMTLFAMGNILLKIRRSRLRRNYRAGWFTVLFAMAATIAGIIGNILIDYKYLGFFLTYFIPTVLVVGLMFLRTKLLALFLYLLSEMSKRVREFNERMSARILENIDKINSQGIIFFTKGDNAANLNKAMLYVRDNELTKIVTVVHLYTDKNKIPSNLKKDLEFLDEVYPEIKINLILKEGEFNPGTIDAISQEYEVPLNYMFIGAPGESFPHNLSELGGVRLII
ncbi:APC family permease [bacterium]|nr:APC family permease [bacterium]